MRSGEAGAMVEGAMRAPRLTFERARKLRREMTLPEIIAPFQPPQIAGIISELRYRMPSDGIDRRAARGGKARES
jgi:hypothetical protein